MNLSVRRTSAPGAAGRRMSPSLFLSLFLRHVRSAGASRSASRRSAAPGGLGQPLVVWDYIGGHARRAEPCPSIAPTAVRGTPASSASEAAACRSRADHVAEPDLRPRRQPPLRRPARRDLEQLLGALVDSYSAPPRPASSTACAGPLRLRHVRRHDPATRSRMSDQRAASASPLRAPSRAGARPAEPRAPGRSQDATRRRSSGVGQISLPGMLLRSLEAAAGFAATSPVFSACA